MNHEDQSTDHELETILGRLPAPTAPSEELQNEVRRRVLDEYDRTFHMLPAETVWRRGIQKGVTIMSHPVSRTLAALAAVLVVVIWLATPRQSIAFGDFLAPIINAKSAKFKVVAKNDVQPKEFSATGYFLAPNRYRQEFAAPVVMISITDFDHGRMLSLMPDKKEAIVFEIKGKPADDKAQANNFFGNLRATLAEYRNNKKGQLEELGEKELDGRRVFGFRLALAGFVQTLWGDANTGQVIRIECTYNGPPKTEVVMSEFEFDVPLDASLFAIDPPEGYKSTSIPVDASPATEQDFLAAMRRLNDVMDGEFPTNLDTPGITGAMVKLFKGKESKEQMTEAIALGRGVGFATRLPPDADVHYAGKGVKRQGPKVPLFWYKPTGSQKYRVIWSDLSASDADTAPEVPGAIRMIEPLNKPKAQ